VLAAVPLPSGGKEAWRRAEGLRRLDGWPGGAREGRFRGTLREGICGGEAMGRRTVGAC
jgi:hypothetical protein